MNKKELAQLLMVICSAYPMVELTEERVNVWHELLSEVPYDFAIGKVKQHIKTEKFPPAISDIYAPYKDELYHEQQKIDTRLRLQERPQPNITPERMAEIQENVRLGVYDEQFKDDPYLRPLPEHVRCRIGDS